ncbi:adenylate/guanylate cyclase domain-containing protein [Anabaena lutea FACHB-196]|uniref:Adenylate/guanylate cyclase domain-containing protein n=2 Tax=Anabaena TaxID=1163 RepID=A0ABR8FQ46_9NOST|nr:adenylate/guanylate cyclase domain-containing protein [Anabaena lutea]MBD2571015.1 adenylate/guanylate cyclase domain-containing protein [Anabaena lutea FACHB-196]
MRVLGLFQMIDWAALDQFFKLRPPEPQDSRIVIVTIDEDTIRKVGQWPIPDAVLAKMLDKIRQQKPLAIGLDLYRDLPVQPGHEQLIQILQSTPNLIGVKKVVGDGLGPEVNPHPILSKRDQIAASDLLLDADGKVRRGIISLEPKSDEQVLSLATRLSLMYLENKGVELQELDADKRHYQLGKATFIPFQKNDGGYIRVDDRGYQILLNFRGTQDNFQKYSIMQVVNGEVPPNWGRDRIVLIGATAASLHDDFFTPYSSSVSAFPERMPGVVIHANVISQILSAALDGRPMMRGSSQEIQWLWIILWSFVGAILGWTLRSQKFIYKNISYRETILSLIVAGSSLIFGSYLVFLRGWWIPVVPPLLGLGGSAIAIAIYTTRLERQDRYTLMALFKQQVTSQVADQIWTSRHNLLQKGSIVGREMTATVLFSDLEGFTSIATTISPTALMSWLNEYMQAMADIVLEYNGMVNKFIGDAVMALFGVPIQRTKLAEITVDAENAVGCALAMADKLRSLNQQWQLSGNPTVAIRIGIATGTVVTGILGNAQRAEYTALGDTVNIASRLESYDKSLNCGLCRILISEETYQHIKDKFPTKFIGSSQLKGRDQLTQIYQVLLS